MEVKKSELCLMACIAIKNCLFSVTDMDENNSTVAFTDEFTGVHGKVVINNDDSFSIILREIFDESPSKEDMGFFEECMTLEDQCIEFHPDMTLTYHEVERMRPKLNIVDFENRKRVLISYDNISTLQLTTMFDLQPLIMKAVMNVIRFRAIVKS